MNIIYFSFLAPTSSWKAVYIKFNLKKKTKQNDRFIHFKVSVSKVEVLHKRSQTSWFALYIVWNHVFPSFRFKPVPVHRSFLLLCQKVLNISSQYRREIGEIKEIIHKSNHLSTHASSY